MTSELYLMRHPALAMEGTCYGQADVLPSPEGLASIPALAELAAAVRPEVIYSSDLQRCRLLAEAVSQRVGLPVHYTSALREISVGEWENRAWAEIEAHDAERFHRWMADYINQTPPGGESGAQLQERAITVVRDILRQHSGRILIVTHSGIIRVLRCYVNGWGLDRHDEVKAHYGELLRVELLERFYSVS